MPKSKKNGTMGSMEPSALSEYLFSGSHHHITTCSLVLSAVGIAHRVESSQGKSELFVAPDDRQQALRQLAAYFTENDSWPPSRNGNGPQAESPNRSKPPTILLMGALAIFYLVTGPWTNANPWFQRGAVDSKAIIENGEWWRLICALTLHADDVHLAGNLIIGSFLVHFLCRTVGSGIGLLLILIGGGLGNLVNIAVRDSPHLSVGFSTAVFAIIGFFTGSRLTRFSTGGIAQFLAPLGAGAGLLAFLGAEGARTDLGAHFFGFAVGIALGIAARMVGLERLADKPVIQALLGLCSLSLILLCWLLAWNVL